MAKNDELRAIHVVYAEWCPHCVPTTVEPMKEAAVRLGVKYVPHNIDTDEVKAADELVRKYGDWSPDYIIPQVFLEFGDGSVKHVLTGYSEGVSFTKKAVDNLLTSKLFSRLKTTRTAK
jgi:glutaredoxin